MYVNIRRQRSLREQPASTRDSSESRRRDDWARKHVIESHNSWASLMKVAGYTLIPASAPYRDIVSYTLGRSPATVTLEYRWTPSVPLSRAATARKTPNSVVRMNSYANSWTNGQLCARIII